MSGKRLPGLGDAPIEPKLHEVMNDLAQLVDMALNGEAPTKQRKNGFILMCFPFDGHDGRYNYNRNDNREDVVVLLKEQLKRFEGQPEVSGRA